MFVRVQEFVLARLRAELRRLQNRERFVSLVIDGKLDVRAPRSQLLRQLRSLGLATESQLTEPTDKQTTSAAAAPAATAETETDTDYDYLLGQPLWSLTQERVQRLRGECAGKQAEVATLTQTHPLQLWLTDLSHLERALDAYEHELRVAAGGGADGKRSKTAVAAASAVAEATAVGTPGRGSKRSKRT